MKFRFGTQYVALSASKALIMNGGNSHAVNTFIFIALIYVLPLIAGCAALVIYTKGTARKIVLYGLGAMLCTIVAYVMIENFILHPNG